MLDLKSVHQQISKAIYSDEKGEPFNACYKNYINGLTLSFELLNSEASDVTMKLPEHVRLLKLCSQCLERVVEKANIECKKAHTNESTMASASQQSPPEPVAEIKDDSSNYTSGTSSFSSSCSISMPKSNRLQSPLEEATARNKQLISSFQKRISQGKCTPAEAASLRLGLQRKLNENLELARNKEPRFTQQLTTALEERQNTIAEVVSRNGHILTTRILEYLYRSMAMFEFHFLTHDPWYQRALQGNKTHIMRLRYVLCIEKHPLTTHLVEMRQHFSSLMLAPGITADTWQGHAKELSHSIDQVAKVAALHLSGETDMRRKPRTLLPHFQSFIFTEKFTTDLLRSLQEIHTETLSKLHEITGIDGEEFKEETRIAKSGIQEKFLFSEDPTAYEAPLRSLMRVVQPNTPLEKLSVLHEELNSLVQYVQTRLAKSATNNSKPVSLASDDLLPILCYIISRSQQPEVLWVHVRFVESFVDLDLLSGAEGYSLTTFIVALEYCCCSLP